MAEASKFKDDGIEEKALDPVISARIAPMGSVLLNFDLMTMRQSTLRQGVARRQTAPVTQGPGETTKCWLS